ncbi:hypothetical protein [Paenibacillus sp. YPG26]|uniref:hypothetical protein n=1 Tax=Paenibacillus sp. YPG26 TaxID=2878915 RepID=UPI00203CC76C|nr:hypothetical protein [Paenibacillus sp. YPG26]USB33924.1 hypothetical protein LDO05_03635 [Paenibacillus sp. YPG26]
MSITFLVYGSPPGWAGTSTGRARAMVTETTYGMHEGLGYFTCVHLYSKHQLYSQKEVIKQ